MRRGLGRGQWRGQMRSRSWETPLSGPLPVQPVCGLGIREYRLDDSAEGRHQRALRIMSGPWLGAWGLRGGRNGTDCGDKFAANNGQQRPTMATKKLLGCSKEVLCWGRGRMRIWRGGERRNGYPQMNSVELELAWWCNGRQAGGNSRARDCNQSTHHAFPFAPSSGWAVNRDGSSKSAPHFSASPFRNLHAVAKPRPTP